MYEKKGLVHKYRYTLILDIKNISKFMVSLSNDLLKNTTHYLLIYVQGRRLSSKYVLIMHLSLARDMHVERNPKLIWCCKRSYCQVNSQRRYLHRGL